jgi:anaerobic selenocysteine-containing dehydrogenase
MMSWQSGAREIIKTTCPRDCYDACGIVVTRRNGVVTKVLGDPDHHVALGALCGKCAVAYNGAWLDDTRRLTKPLLRSGPKGTGSFVESTWDIVLPLIASRLESTTRERGGAAIAHTHYTGTCAAIAGNFPSRFFNRLGAVEIDPDSVCNKAGHMALGLIFGSSLDGFDPRSAPDTNCILVWGANPSSSAPHAHRHWLFNNSAKRVVVDPIRHETAAKADLHLQLFPGSDASMAFALLNVLKSEGWLDLEFIGRHTIGWDEIQPDIDAMTPHHAAVLTGVDPQLIAAAARMYAEGPSLLWMGQGMQRQRTGGNVMRSVALLPIATGNIGKRGSGFLYMNGFDSRGIRLDDLSGADLRPRDAPAAVSHMDLCDHLESAEGCSAFVTWNNNIVASNPQQSRLKAALSRESLFHVAIDLFPTDTTRFADVVLPAASFLEFDDIVVPYFNYDISAQVGVRQAPGDALPNQEIFRRLARHMRLDDPPLHESDEEMIAKMLQATGLGIDFAELAAAGTLRCRNDIVVPFADRVFPTPSGKIEIASDRFAEAGVSRAPSARSEDRPASGHVRVLSPASLWLMNSSYGNDDRIRKFLGEQNVSVNPVDVERNGLHDGDYVELVNDAGRLGPLKLIATEAVPAGAVVVPKGRWPSLEGDTGANVNVLNDGRKSDLGASTSVHSIQAILQKAGTGSE